MALFIYQPGRRSTDEIKRATAPFSLAKRVGEKDGLVVRKSTAKWTVMVFGPGGFTVVGERQRRTKAKKIEKEKGWRQKKRMRRSSRSRSSCRFTQASRESYVQQYKWKLRVQYSAVVYSKFSNNLTRSLNRPDRRHRSG